MHANMMFDSAVCQDLISIPFAKGHGVLDRSIGGAAIYYVIACQARARTCVCLGSGGGFVPMLMRFAQRDMGLEGAVTYLVDAILPEAGFGGPETPGGWIHPDSLMRTQFPEVVILNCLTAQAGRKFFPKNRIQIDYLHIDADHSFEGVLSDFELFLPLLAPYSFVTFHDTGTASVHRALGAVAERYTQFQCLDIPDFGAGIAILRQRKEL